MKESIGHHAQISAKCWCASVLVLLTLTAANTGATNVPLIFADGFASGDTCAWGGTCADPAVVDGVWIGTLDFDGTVRPITIQLSQRGDGRVMGYLLGGTSKRIVVDGEYAAGTLDLRLGFQRVDSADWVRMVGPVAGAVWTGTATTSLGPQAFSFQMWPGVVHERRYIFADSALGEDANQEMGVALSDTGVFLSGGFSGPTSCLLWACDGGLSSFAETPDTITFGLETSGGCSTGSTATVVYNPTQGYFEGSYSFTDCAGTATGSVASGPVYGTRSDHVAQILSRLGSVADEFEGIDSFVVPHPAFADDYLHNGDSLTDLFNSWNSMRAGHASIELWVEETRQITTVEVARAVENFAIEDGAVFELYGVGEPDDGSKAITIYYDTVGDILFNPAHNPMRVWEEIDGQWLISGNREPALDLPWEWAMSGGGDRLDSPTAGNPVHISLGVYGGHFTPHTGHAFGDTKSNFVAYLPANDSEMSELLGDAIGDDDGFCEPGEECAYYGGLTGDGTCAVDGCLVRDRTPVYLAPQSGTVSYIEFQEGPSGDYFDNPPQWVVELRFASGIVYRLVHVAAFASEFSVKVAAATGCDPEDWADCGLSNGQVILDEGAGDPPIPVAVDEAIAHPQIMAAPVPGHPGYYLGNGTFPDYPWAQMEIFARGTFDLTGYKFCIYNALADERFSTLESALTVDVSNPNSQRYALGFSPPQWQWGAETALCNEQDLEPFFSNSLTSRLGGWFERDESATTPDEIMGWVPINKEGPGYDASLYDPSNPDALIIRQRSSGGGTFSWLMPDGSTVTPVFASAEVLDVTDDSMLLMWRDIGYTAGNIPVYQRTSYEQVAQELTIKWGAFGATPASTPHVFLEPGDTCNDTTVICYDNEE